MQIKDLAHARELMEQGVLIPCKTVLRDRDGKERLFLGFTRKGNLVTDDYPGDGSNAYCDSNVEYWQFTIIKPKKKIKLECWVCFTNYGHAFAVNNKEYTFETEPKKNFIHIEHICKEIEVEDE